MRPSRRPIIIATRKSRLALAQSQAVANALAKLNPNIGVRLLPMDTRGDQMLSHPLAGSGGKGLFTRALESALLREKADLAVHSLKDMPTDSTSGLVIAAVPKRGDVRDCLIAHTAESIDALPPNATIGTASRRRAAQLAQQRPDLRFETLRGNIETRIQRVKQDKQFDATLLAVAGLQRGGLGGHANHPIPTDVMLPAAGQAALAIQCRAGDHVTLRRCLPLNDSLTAACVEAERSVIAKLAGDCTSPLAVLAEPVEGGKIRIRARALKPDGSQCIEADDVGTLRQLRHTADRVIKYLIAHGAPQIIRPAGEVKRVS